VEYYAALDREVATLSTIYGPRHPTYQEGQAKLALQRERLRSLRDAPFDEAHFDRVFGQSLLPAQRVTIPSSPNPALVFMVAALAGIGLATAFVLWRDRRRLSL
jgi:uncharacterized protein involved in exopolysaccharide biosynthesis